MEMERKQKIWHQAFIEVYDHPACVSSSGSSMRDIEVDLCLAYENLKRTYAVVYWQNIKVSASDMTAI